MKSKSGIDILVYFRSPADLEMYFRRCIEAHVRRNPMISSLSEQEIIDGALPFNPLIIGPHPFAPSGMGLATAVECGALTAQILEHIPILETMNGAMSRQNNDRAAAWAATFRKRISAGSDAHVPGCIGKLVTCAKLQPGEQFIDAIQREDAILCGSPPNHLLSALIFVLGQMKVCCRREGFRMFRELVRVYAGKGYYGRLRLPPSPAMS